MGQAHHTAKDDCRWHCRCCSDGLFRDLEPGNPDAATNNTLTLFCTMLVLLVCRLPLLFGRPAIWTALTLAGAFVAVSLVVMLLEPRVPHAAMDDVTIARNQVRIGMTINDVLPLVHGMDITASTDGVWLSGLPDNKLFYYSPGSLSLVQHDDGTFTFWCDCATERVSRNSRVTESQVVELVKEKPLQVLKNLTESQAAELMKQRMSGGYEWHWKFEFLKDSLLHSFTVTFGPDGRVKHITDVHTTDVRSHRP